MNNPTTTRRARRLGATMLLSGLAALGFGITPAHATTGILTSYNGDPQDFTCAKLAPEGKTWLEYKRDNWAGDKENGKHVDDPNGLEIAISNADFQTFDWDSNFDIAAVLVKGGAVGNVYSYPGGTDIHDEDLVAPVNPPKNQADEPKNYDISHVSFCFELPGDTPEEDPRPECVDDHLPTGEPCRGDTPDEETPGPQCIEGQLPNGECAGPPVVEEPGPEDKPADKPADETKVEVQSVNNDTQVLGETLEQATELPRTGTETPLLAGAGAALLALGLASVATSKVAARSAR